MMKTTVVCRPSTLLLVTALLLGGCSDEPAPPSATADAAPGAPQAATPPAPDDLRKASTAQADAPAAAAPPGDGTVREIEWDSLIPDDYRPDKLMAEYDLDAISDEDPRAAEFMEKLKALWDQAPVRDDLDGATVKLPGFVVPVEADENETTGFLLVPYYGACIHVPPPPANQTVYVVTERGKGARSQLFDVVWVTGTMSVKRIENDIAEAGYTIYATDIAPYE